MLVSHRYRFIYMKTVKTAGTSVESYFERFCMPDGVWTPLHGRPEYESSTGIIGFRGGKKPHDCKWWNHMSAELVREKIGIDVWCDYFKFCVIRNPFEKCISAFEHLGRKHQVDEQLLSSRACYSGMSPEQIRFCDFVEKHPPIDRDKYLIGEEFCMDDVIRFESLTSDIRRICDRLGVPFETNYLPAFKAKIRRLEATAEALYTDRTRTLVSNNFRFEIDRFGYKFPLSA